MLYIIINSEGATAYTNNNKIAAFNEEVDAETYIDDYMLEDAKPYLDWFLTEEDNVKVIEYIEE